MVPNMRFIVLLLLLLSICPTLAAEVYRWVDEDGVVHYTDKSPDASAEPADLPALQPYQPRSAPSREDGENAHAAVGGTPDYQLRIASPAQDQVIRSPQPAQTVSAAVKPPLAKGHGLRFVFDGQDVNEQPTRSASIQIPAVYRGTHTLSVSVVDGNGKELKRSDTVTFHKIPPTVKHNAP